MKTLLYFSTGLNFVLVAAVTWLFLDRPDGVLLSRTAADPGISPKSLQAPAPPSFSDARHFPVNPPAMSDAVPAAVSSAAVVRSAASASAASIPGGSGRPSVSAGAPRQFQPSAAQTAQNPIGFASASGIGNPAPAAAQVSVPFSVPASGVGGGAVQFAPDGGGYAGGSAGNPGAADAGESVVLPAALVPHNPEIPITTETQVTEWEKLQDDFIDDIGGTTQDLDDPASRERWVSAQEYNDWMFRAKFGTYAFLLQNAEAGRLREEF